mgnify:CR=1 FL=1
MALVLLYYFVVGAWSYFTLRAKRVRAERQLLHLRARTLAVEARRQRLKDPDFARMLLERRLRGSPKALPDSSAPPRGADGETLAP